jgi:hypothetical protein
MPRPTYNSFLPSFGSLGVLGVILGALDDTWGKLGIILGNGGWCNLKIGLGSLAISIGTVSLGSLTTSNQSFAESLIPAS